MFLPPLTGRWYIREGWLKVVPPKGADATPKMFFLFSDMLLQAKRCSPLQFNSKDKFTGQHAFPLQDCTVEKVFGHTRSRGGLLSVSRPAGVVHVTQNRSLWQEVRTVHFRPWIRTTVYAHNAHANNISYMDLSPCHSQVTTPDSCDGGSLSCFPVVDSGFVVFLCKRRKICESCS